MHEEVNETNNLLKTELADNESPEHFRYAAMKLFLKGNPCLDDLTISRFIELADLDEDQTMAQPALALLAKNENLTNDQLQALKTHPAFRTPTLQNIITQHELLRALDSDRLTDELFDRCLMIGNRDVQRKLVGRQDLSAEQLMELMTNGSSRAIRNLAKQAVHKIQRHIDRDFTI